MGIMSLLATRAEKPFGAGLQPRRGAKVAGAEFAAEIGLEGIMVNRASPYVPNEYKKSRLIRTS
jgi:hypothetical protein